MDRIERIRELVILGPGYRQEGARLLRGRTAASQGLGDRTRRGRCRGQQHEVLYSREVNSAIAHGAGPDAKRLPEIR